MSLDRAIKSVLQASFPIVYIVRLLSPSLPSVKHGNARPNRVPAHGHTHKPDEASVRWSGEHAQVPYSGIERQPHRHLVKAEHDALCAHADMACDWRRRSGLCTADYALFKSLSVLPV